MPATSKYVALFRGINVGTAKQLSMADLKRVLDDLGFQSVNTVLRSGSAVFSTDSRPTASTIEAAVEKATGIHSDVIVLSAAEFTEIVDANPLIEAMTDGSKSFITFVDGSLEGVESPDVGALSPELMAIGTKAIYQWMPDGSLQTKVPKSFWKSVRPTLTARNLNTVKKVQALLEG